MLVSEIAWKFLKIDSGIQNWTGKYSKLEGSALKQTDESENEWLRWISYDSILHDMVVSEIV